MAVSLGKRNRALKVLLADDHPQALERASKILSSNYQVIAAVNNGLMASDAAKDLSPDLIVLDIQMPEMDGFRAAQEIRRQGLKARIIFLTVQYSEDFITAARALGDGYVSKFRMTTDLPKAIDESLAGRFFVSHF